MPQRTFSIIVFVLLAACQSTSAGLESQEEWRSEIEGSQAELMREMRGIRSLLDR